MQPLYKTVDVIIERVPLANRWASERWQPQCVELVEASNGAAASRERVFQPFFTSKRNGTSTLTAT